MRTVVADAPLARLLQRIPVRSALPARGRTPVGVLYGGAHRFSKDTPAKLGRLAREAFERWTPDAITLAHAVGLQGAGALPRDSDGIERALRDFGDAPPLARAREVHSRLAKKLDVEPVEDLRIDFEDGLGPISDTDEDALAVRAGTAAATCIRERTAPPFFGVRCKPLGDDSGGVRGVRTLDLFFCALRDAAPDVERWPNLVVTLPKVEHEEEVAAAAAALSEIERTLDLPEIGLEVMIESARGLWSDDGRLRVPLLIGSGGGRVRGVHFGTYDYSASLGIPAPHQRADHAACDLARQLIVASCAGSEVVVSDGATHEMPIGPHRGLDLDDTLEDENRRVVENALRLHAANIERALLNGIHLGWDLHPTQLLARYATTFAFFRGPLASMTTRMRAYLSRAAEASLTGSMFDDAASAEGVLIFFLRGHECGALDDADLDAAGVTDDIRHARSLAPLRHRAPSGESGA